MHTAPDNFDRLKAVNEHFANRTLPDGVTPGRLCEIALLVRGSAGRPELKTAIGKNELAMLGSFREEIFRIFDQLEANIG